jgi:uncharacterized protein YndB with AHSA1/START domain
MSATMTTETQSVTSFKIVKEQTIAAPIEIVFQAMLDELGPECQMMEGKPFPMKLEPWPGGRWFRDLGHDGGHLWGHVQVIKSPTLLEITGPMPMSYPAVNHLEYRLTAQGNGTVLKFTHQSMGLITPEHRDGMPHGWEFGLNRIRQIAEGQAGKKR